MQEQTFYLCRHWIGFTVDSPLSLSLKVPTDGAVAGTTWANHEAHHSFAFRNGASYQTDSPRSNAMDSTKADQAALRYVARCTSVDPRSREEGFHNPIAGGTRTK